MPEDSRGKRVLGGLGRTIWTVLGSIPCILMVVGLPLLGLKADMKWFGILGIGMGTAILIRWITLLIAYLLERKRLRSGEDTTPPAVEEDPHRYGRRALIILFVFGATLFLVSRPFSARSVTFYDTLHDRDVSQEYVSKVPMSRYLIEPLAGLSFRLGFSSDVSERLPMFVVLFIGFRFLMLVLSGLKGDLGRRSLFEARPLNGMLHFMARAGTVVLVVVGWVLWSIDKNLGYIGLANTFARGLHWGSYIGLSLLAFKLILDFVRSLGCCGSPSLSPSGPPRRFWLFLPLKIVKDEGERVWGAFLLFFAVGTWLSGLLLPTQRIVGQLKEGEVLYDFHVHTLLSDGQLTPGERVRWYVSQGLQGAAFADHHHPKGAFAAQKYVQNKGWDFTVLTAQEYTAKRIHMNVYGIDEAITPKGYSKPEGPNPLEPPELIPWVKARGGYVTVNHYREAPGEPYTYEELKNWGVDGFEIVNGGSFGGGFSDIRDFCVKNGLACLTGTDMHESRELNSFVRLTLEDPKDRSVDAIFKALRKNEHECVAIPAMDYDHRFRPEADFEEIGLMKEYFLTLDPLQSLSWALWSVLIFGLAWRSLKSRSAHQE